MTEKWDQGRLDLVWGIGGTKIGWVSAGLSKLIVNNPKNR